MNVIQLRAPDGRYATRAAAGERCTVAQARAHYETFLAAVCARQGLTPKEVKRQLARPGRPNFDTQWRRAVYARQLALYLANTVHNVPQVRLADVTGLTKAAVCLALQAIEDLREDRAFDRNVETVAIEMEARA
jgi:hypothetical protein